MFETKAGTSMYDLTCEVEFKNWYVKILTFIQVVDACISKNVFKLHGVCV